MQHLKSKRIVLGITGGVAAYKAAEFTRLLIKAGCDVQVVMTEGAQQFITPLTLQALSGKPVCTHMWDGDAPNGMPHIELSRHADAIVIAPCTAEFMAKLLHGRADDLLSALCLAREQTCPLLIAPAMNKQMWENPATQRNASQLQADGITLLGPDSGEQACGETGMGRMLEPHVLLQQLNGFFTPKLLAGKHVLITAGATQEAIDPVRVITNLSSGRMGLALAQTAADMGAQVTLVHSKIENMPSLQGNIHAVAGASAASMYQAIMQHVKDADIFIGVAAVADYTPVAPSTEKIKKSEQSLTLQLNRTKDILADVASLPNAPFCVGFAAETQDLLKFAEQKRIAKKLPLLVANLVNESMGQDETSVTLLDAQGNHPLPRADKQTIATQILTHLARMLAP